MRSALAAPSDPPNADLTPAENHLRDPCRDALEYRNELEQLLQAYSGNHPDVLRLRELVESAKAECFVAGDHMPRSGEWVDKDGVLQCDGYMTRRADQDYCSAETPEDWVPFTFDGKKYYMQPLTESQ